MKKFIVCLLSLVIGFTLSSCDFSFNGSSGEIMEPSKPSEPTLPDTPIEPNEPSEPTLPDTPIEPDDPGTTDDSEKKEQEKILALKNQIEHAVVLKFSGRAMSRDVEDFDCKTIFFFEPDGYDQVLMFGGDAKFKDGIISKNLSAGIEISEAEYLQLSSIGYSKMPQYANELSDFFNSEQLQLAYDLVTQDRQFVYAVKDGYDWNLDYYTSKQYQELIEQMCVDDFNAINKRDGFTSVAVNVDFNFFVVQDSYLDFENLIKISGTIDVQNASGTKVVSNKVQYYFSTNDDNFNKIDMIDFAPTESQQQISLDQNYSNQDLIALYQVLTDESSKSVIVQVAGRDLFVEL